MTDYDKLKVAELKDLVKDRGIVSTGLKLKQQYIDALLADDFEKEEDASVKSKNATAQEGDENAAATAEIGNDASRDAAGGDEAGEGEATNNKRKRRSATPPVREESINKKLKTAEDTDQTHVQLPEDVVADTPVEVDNASNAQETIQPFGSSDDVLELQNAEQPGQSENKLSENEGQNPVEEQDAVMKDIADVGPPSRHPATRAIYIGKLVRPVPSNTLRDHLLSIIRKDPSAEDSNAIQSFHIDRLRSHAFALLGSKAAAIKVRSELHGVVWPDEPMRKPLWVDFIPEEKVQEWIDIEVEKADMTRWEVVYEESTADGSVTARLEEVDSPTAARKMSQPTNVARPPPPGSGEGMPNAPSGPRQMLPPRGPAGDRERPKPAPSESFVNLDSVFNSTEAKPKIYYQPVSGDLARRRLDELDNETSKDWDEADADPSGYAEDQLRRYHFEDGDRIVDGGPDFGMFGRRHGVGGGGAGGGGARGRGRGRGDYYRGGSRRR